MGSPKSFFPPNVKPSGCEGCPLQHKGKGFVPGYGDPDASLVLILERPGNHEIGNCKCGPSAHPRGRPTVGATGKVLDTVLQSGRPGVFTTNVRRCYAEFETKEEKARSIEHCVNHFLNPELASLKATHIHLMGGDAALTGMGWGASVKLHGSFWLREWVDAILATAQNLGLKEIEDDELIGDEKPD